MNKINITILTILLLLANVTGAQTPKVSSELDYLTDMPVVLSVSRLPQRLDETPGAVTVLDRDMIRLSGARDVADLMRLVPGFQTSSSFERIGPQASYHGAFTSYANHVQVLVDGRSVYSPYFVGSTEAGLQTVALEDIERIEVLRGSNSAAYGARAMLGVINIVTRHTADSLGVEVGLGSGQNGIRDQRASIGWGQPGTTFRLGVDRRADDGLLGANGHNQISRVNLRADLSTSARDDVQLRAGGLGIGAGKGNASNPGDPFRDQAYSSSYFQLDWRRTLSADEELAVFVSHGQEIYKERFPYLFYGLCCVDINASGGSSNDALSVQHSYRQNADVRVVWGAEWRREQVNSKGLYNTDATYFTDFSRLFGNVEWRMLPQWLLNAGALAEKSSVSGDNLAPRLMLNWHVNEGQTLRAGVSRAFRPPSTFENFANIQFYFNDAPVFNSTLSSGSLLSERILSRELGYLGEFQNLKLNLDVRLFHEQLSDLITQVNGPPKDYENNDNFSIKGLEYQLKWRPWTGAQLVLNQSYTEITSLNLNRVLAAPKLANAIAIFQKLGGGLNLSLLHQNSTLSTLAGSDADFQRTLARTDVRLSAPLRFGLNKGEVALVVQNLGAPYSDFFPQFQFERRAFVTLRVEN